MKDDREPLAPEDPVSSEVFIQKILKRFKKTLDSSENQLSANWSVVLPSMSQLCSFVSLKDGVLTVSCNHPAKASAVRMNKGEIIKNIKGVFPDLDVKSVIVRIYK